MKRFISFALVLTLVLAMVPAAFAAPATPFYNIATSETIVTCTGDRVRIRDGAWGSILGYANKGDRFMELAKDGEWSTVWYNGRIASIFSAYLSSASGSADSASPSTETGKVLEIEAPLEKSAMPVITSLGFSFPIAGTANPEATLTMYVFSSNHGARDIDVTKYMADGNIEISMQAFGDELLAAYNISGSVNLTLLCIAQTEPGKAESDPVIIFFDDYSLPT